MTEDKSKWVELIRDLLWFDGRSEVSDITYFVKDGTEIVKIRYIGGAESWINVTINSLGAILKEIVAEVYGNGAVGRFRYGFPPFDEAGDTE